MVSFATIAELMPYVVEGIKQVEKIFPGRKRGAEKKEGSINHILANLRDIVSLNETPKNWLALAISNPEFSKKLGAAIDAIVDLKNFLSDLDEIPDDPKVVN